MAPLALLALALLGLAAAVALYGFNLCARWQHRHLPGPRPKWVLGNASRAPSDPHQLGAAGKSFVALQRWARQYGDCFVMFMGRQPLVVLSDPELIREAGVRGFRTFHDRPAGRIRAGPPPDMQLQDRGIVVARGKYWSGVRASCEPLFHTAALEGYAPAMNQAIDGLVARLDAACGSDVGVDMSDALAAMTMDVIMRTAFGVDLQAQSTAEPSALLAAAKVFFRPFGGIGPLLTALFFGFPPLGQLVGWLALKLRAPRIVALCEARAVLWGATQQLLDNARAGAAAQGDLGDTPYGRPPLAAAGPSAAGSGAGKDGVEAAKRKHSLAEMQAAEFARGREAVRGAVPHSRSIMHMLRNAKNAESGVPLSDLEICAQLFTFLLAGYETTSLALSYALFQLAKQPALQARVAAEVAALGLAPGEAPSYAHLPRLPLTAACFDEAMRLYPPASALVVLAREAREGTRVGPYHIPKGSTVVFNVFGVHRDPRHYPYPEEFRPERFLPGSEEAGKRHPAAFLPFGVGPRKCIGYKFALEEGVLALACLLARFEFAPDPDHHPPGRPLELEAGVTLTPKGGIWLRVAQRGSA